MYEVYMAGSSVHTFGLLYFLHDKYIFLYLKNIYRLKIDLNVTFFSLITYLIQKKRMFSEKNVNLNCKIII